MLKYVGRDWFLARAARGGGGGTGTVVTMLMGQSQMEYLINSGAFYRQIAQPTPGTDNLVLFMQTGNGASPTRVSVNPTTVAAGSVNPAMAALSAFLDYTVPGRKFVLTDGIVTGLSRRALYDDTTNASDLWWWSDLAATVSMAEAEFGPVRHIIENWYDADGTLLPTFKASLWPFYFGTDAAGASVALGSTVNGRQLDHILWDGTAAAGDKGRGLFARSTTSWHILTPTPYADAPTFPTEWDNFSGTIPIMSEPIRDVMHSLTSDTLAQSVNLRVGPSAHITNTDGGQHPLTTDADGQPLMVWPIAVAMLRAAGRTINEPTVYAIEGPTDGSYADLVIDLPNGGNLTTLRAFRGLAMPGTPSPHQQAVTGFEIARGASRRPIYRTSETSYPSNHRGTVTITDAGSGSPRRGRVRITPTNPFAFGNGISYLRGQASAIMSEPRDVSTKLYLDMLIEHVPSLYNAAALYPFEGIAVRPYQNDLQVNVPAPAFVARGAYFDGSTYYGQTSGISITPSSSGLLSMWFRNDDSVWNTPAGRVLVTLTCGSTDNFQLYQSSAGRLTLRHNNSTATDTITFQPSIGLFAPASWFHMFAAWNGTGLTIYINGVSVGTLAYATLDMAGVAITRLGFGSRSNGVSNWKGDIAHLWLSVTQTMDLSVQANREKFVLAGQPVDLGGTGSLPTGTAPEWYYDGSAPAWDNKGTAGNITLTGTLTASSSAPSY